MSALEEKVKPIISGFLHGHSSRINNDQIIDLSLWVAVKTIVGEHAEDRVALTPSADRHLVYMDRIIPEYFRIFAGLHSSETMAAYVRHSTTISLTRDGPNPPMSSDVRRNIQIVTFLVGPLVLHVIAARVADFNIDEVFSLGGLAKLWPRSQEDIDLSSLKRLDDIGLGIIAGRLDRLISSLSVRYGGPLPDNKEGNGGGGIIF